MSAANPSDLLDIIVADAEGMMFYTIPHPISHISRQFWSWLMLWATPIPSIRSREEHIVRSCILELDQNLNRLTPPPSPTTGC